MTLANESVLLRSDRDGIATLTLNRPAARNALSGELIAALQRELDCIADDPNTRAVVIAANGPAFCAGHDLAEVMGFAQPGEFRTLAERCSVMMQTVTHLPRPVIAKVQAVATAAGCQLVAACDLAVAADSAKFATPGVNIGLFCHTPQVALSRKIAPGHALQMLLTGEPVTADEAWRMGLVNKVVPAAELDAAVDTLARTVASKSSYTQAIGKKSFHDQLDRPLADAYAAATEHMVENMHAEDAREGIGAFLEKRAPRWRDR
jgi:enoyl-CoA hydratase/carnithine racemase